MNVLLLRPPNLRPSYFSRFNLSEPLTEIYLGPALAGAHDVRLLDLRVLGGAGRGGAGRGLERELDRFARGGWRPQAAVVAAHPLNLGGLDALLARLEVCAPGLRILLVGAAEYGVEHVVERPQEYFRPLADALLPGYFLAPVRRIVAETLAAWEAGRDLATVPGLWVQSRPGHWEQTELVPHVVGDVGIPDRRLLGRTRGRYSLGGVGRTAYVIYSYGCRFSCRYCSMSKSNGPMITRPIPDVIEELAELREPNVFLADFEPLQAPEAMLRLADSIQAEGIRKRWYLLTRADSALDQAHVLERWKEIGLSWVFLGLDGHSEARLRQIGKGATMAVNAAAVERVRRLGLGPAIGLTVPPDATHEDFAAIAQAARSLRAPLVDFTVETPMVGTRWHDEVADQLTTRDLSLFDMHHAVLPTRMPLDEFYREMTKLHALAGRLSMPGMVGLYPWRDVLRNLARGSGAMLGSWRSARDHGAHGHGARGPGPREHAVA